MVREIHGLWAQDGLVLYRPERHVEGIVDLIQTEQVKSTVIYHSQPCKLLVVVFSSKGACSPWV